MRTSSLRMPELRTGVAPSWGPGFNTRSTSTQQLWVRTPASFPVCHSPLVPCQLPIQCPTGSLPAQPSGLPQHPPNCHPAPCLLRPVDLQLEPSSAAGSLVSQPPSLGLGLTKARTLCWAPLHTVPLSAAQSLLSAPFNSPRPPRDIQPGCKPDPSLELSTPLSWFPAAPAPLPPP